MTMNIRRWPARLVLPIFIVALVLAGCSNAESSSSNGNATATGDATYQQSCASCHGTELRGTDEGPPLLSQVYEPGHHPDMAFVSAVKNGSPAHHWGFGDMPPVPEINDNEIEAVIAYIRNQQETHGYEPYPPQ